MTVLISPSDPAPTASEKAAKRPVSVWIAGLAGAVIALLLTLAASERLDRLVFDSWQRMAPRDLAASDVRVVTIDADSLKELGAWPWPRAYIAALTQEISARGATVIGYDMIFAEPDRLNPPNIVSLYPEMETQTAAAMESLPSMDGILEDTLRRHPVILGRAGLVAGGKRPVDILQHGVVTGDVDRIKAPFSSVLTNLDQLDGAALSVGMLNGPPDGDGIVRKVPLAVKVDGVALPGFAMELARNARDLDPATLDNSIMHLGDQAIPVDDLARMRLHMGRVPLDHIFSAANLFRQGGDENVFEGKVVLVGLAAEGTADLVSTPLAKEGYGVLVQAQAVDTLLRGGWLTRPDWAIVVQWVAVLLLVVLIGVATRFRHSAYIALALGFALIVPFATWFAFTSASVLINPLPTWIIGAGASLGVFGASFMAARRERERLREQLVRDQISAAAIEGELQAARSIQMNMLPDRKKLGQIDDRLDVAAILEEAKTVGGDFYDVFRLDADHIVLVIADVTGKGVPAALFMALSKALTKSVVSRDWSDIAECVALLNRQLMDDDGGLLGLTMLLCLVDLRDGRIEMVNAGHENPIIFGSEGVARTHLMEGGPPLCVVDYPYPLEVMHLQPDEILVLLTDGVTEAHNPQNSVFGVSGTIAAIEELRPRNAGEVVEKLAQKVLAFEAGGDPTDDMTILAFRHIPQ